MRRGSIEAGRPIYVVGAGSIGFPLAAFLARNGREAIAVRTTRDDIDPGIVEVVVRMREGVVRQPVRAVSLAKLERLNGTVVVAVKAFANEAIAAGLERRSGESPIVLLQNGIGVESPFIGRAFPTVLRAVLYATSQAGPAGGFDFRLVKPSPIGLVKGEEDVGEATVAAISTPEFPFYPEPAIERDIWKKSIVNVVFNSVCPLIDADNGIFHRDGNAASVARLIIEECARLMDRVGLELGSSELVDQVMEISAAATGQRISTLQDISSGRPTEIEFLNLEVARRGSQLTPPVRMPLVESLGRMIVLKAGPAPPHAGSAAT